MRCDRFRCVPVAVFLTLSIASLAQLATTTPQVSSPQPQAIVSNAISAAGWSAVQRPTSAVASGTITRYAGDSNDTSPIRIRFNGTGSYAVETEYGGVLTKIVVRDGSAARWNNGTATLMSPTSVKSWHFPFLLDLLDLSPANARTEYVGAEQIAGQTADRIHVWREPNPKDIANFMPTKIGSHLTLWVSKANALPLQIEYRKQNYSRLSFRTRRRVLGDYRSVGGVMVPYYQEEWDGKEKLWSIQLDSVQWNVPLTASDFPLSQGGQQ